jgi:hypothetical protein
MPEAHTTLLLAALMLLCACSMNSEELRAANDKCTDAILCYRNEMVSL